MKVFTMKRDPYTLSTAKIAKEQARLAKTTKTAFADSGCSSSISRSESDFVAIFYTKEPYVIDTAQAAASMKTHFYGTTRVWAKGDGDEWLLMTQEDVLYVPEASEDLLSLSKLTKHRWTVTIQAGVLELRGSLPQG